ncbi:hypothetical protein C2E23DRAFT_734202 [Lenzites betulinus]|nr:hypothetical protein C2E23DRAFT_734202 [Lenzites betulinus]
MTDSALLYRPLPRRYAVIQMDPVGMVSHFQDPIATAAAQAIHPKKYLVYLDVPLGLPTLNCRWYRYDIGFIATSLRPENKKSGLTPDMVVPICPNTDHPSGPHESVEPTPSFPFSNCYHWVDSNMLVRIRRPEERFDHSHAFQLEPSQHLKLHRLFENDAIRGQRAVDERRAQDIPQSTGEEDVIIDDNSLRSGPEGSLERADPVSEAHSSRNSSYDSLNAILRMDPCGFFTDDNVEVIPLVNMWFELQDHLTADTIANPMGLLEEEDTIVQIIRDARERAPSTKIPVNDSIFNLLADPTRRLAMLPIGEPKYAKHMPTFIHQQILRIFQLEGEQPVALDQQPAAKPAKVVGKGPKVWRTIKRTVARMVHLPCRCTHPPFLPFWP